MFKLLSVTLLMLSAAVTGVPTALAVTGGEASWASYAIELTAPGSWDDSATNAIAWQRRPTRAEAQQAALSNCQSISKNPQNCQVKDSYNQGCAYIALGDTPWGQMGWAQGSTPQEAYDKCHANNLNCKIPVYGGCSNPALDRSRTDVIEAPRIRYWIAVAFGSGEDSRKGYTRANTRTGPDRATAEARAVAACNKDDQHGLYCRAVGAFNQGCGYIATGFAGKNAEQGYGTGTSAQAAYDSCVSHGWQCDTSQVAGACIR